MGDRIQLPAIEEGRAAYGAGEPRDANPYEKGTPWHAMWQDGWFEARDEDREDLW